jgi:GT2 family glycosyltransferase
MSVTVVIVNWNSGRYLGECLRHLENQTCPPTQVFLVDNASTDGSAKIAGEFPSVTLIPSPVNLGFAAGNNLALRCCDTEFVALLNPDAYPEPDWLERLVAAARARPDVAAFGSRQTSLNRPGPLDGIGDTYHITGRVWRERYLAPETPADLLPCEIFSPCAAAALYRRDALMKCGLFDEDYFCYVEDVDLGFRLRLAGHKSWYVPEAVVRHAGSVTTGGQQGDFAVYHGHRNLVWAFVKNMPSLLLWPLLPAHLLLNAGTLLWFALKGRSRVIVRAKADAIRGLPSAWRKRRAIQARRVATVAEIWRALDKRLIPRRR